MMPKFLENYPFKQPQVRIAKGFSAGGKRGSLPEERHCGIDYIWLKGEESASFEVFTMFEGKASFGVSELLGKYFVISTVIGRCQYDAVYAHLDFIAEDLQKYAIIRGDRDFIIPARYQLGWAVKAGRRRGLRQLHLEIHERNLENGKLRKLDPYGIYGSQFTDKYPQPGQPLSGLDHCWTSDVPPLAI